MKHYLIYAHLSAVNVSVGETLNGKKTVGVIGNTGNSNAPHLHFGYLFAPESNFNVTANEFLPEKPYVTNPHKIMDGYGKPSPNDITGDWREWYGTYYHEGIDYSGNIDKSYETKYVNSLPKANSKVKKSGYHNLYGNYVILEILGKKEEEVKQDYNEFNLQRIGEVKDYILELTTEVSSNHNVSRIEDFALELWGTNGQGHFKTDGQPNLEIVGRTFTSGSNLVRFKVRTDELPTGKYAVMMKLKKDGHTHVGNIKSDVEISGSNKIYTTNGKLVYKKI